MKCDLLLKRHGSTHLVVCQLPENDSEFQIEELFSVLEDEIEETRTVTLVEGVREGCLPVEVYLYGQEENS